MAVRVSSAYLPNMAHLSDPLLMARGPALKNRFMLAPLTNQQSHADGTLSDEEFHWLTMRAKGGFALTMTCAAHVQKNGQAFEGQLGIWDDKHLPGLTRLASAIRAAGSISSVQLHHGGRRAEPHLTGEPRRGAFDCAETDTKAYTTTEVEQLRDDFVAAAIRAEKAGFDGVELHGAHGYILGAFLDTENTPRTDKYGGSLENRSRILFEILDGIRASTKPDFQIGVRLSPERFGIQLSEAKQVAAKLMATHQIDFLDLSLWDAFKEPAEPAYAGTRLIDHFMDIERFGTAVGVAGKLMTAAQAQAALDAGADFAVIGRGAILHHDFPQRATANPDFESRPRPVAPEILAAEGLSPSFIQYMRNWPGFVAE